MLDKTGATFFRFVVCVLCCRVALLGQSDSAPKVVDFNRDIRPILSDQCYTCHGPDKANRLTKLRFDVETDAKQDLGGHSAIVPGNPAKSEMVQRITAGNAAKRMPPLSSGRKLTEGQIELIRAWIEQGAKWGQHWSFVPPQRPSRPDVKNNHWPRNEIDYFVQDRLEREGLSPSPEAERTTLIRRVTLDLTGLPPTPAEVDAFLNDHSSNAYEKVVDRLLQSPRYGERMAVRWLDAARYADTNGYQGDGERFMWRWRDWVISAYNRNLPFDRFSVDQIAGDMLPNATLEQKIASGFNRNHRGNSEGGIIPEEYAVEYVADRVETTSTVFLGLTLGCARCHDHKYDPFKQKEFYQLFAYFNNLPEKGKAKKYGNSPPVMQAPTESQRAQLDELDKKLAAAETRFAAMQAERFKAQRAWESSLDKSAPLHWSIPQDLLAYYPLDGEVAGQVAPPPKKPAAYTSQSDVDLPQGRVPEDHGPAVAKMQDGQPEFVAGRIGKAASFDGKRFINAGNVAVFGYLDKFTLAAWIYPTEDTGAVITRAQDIPEGSGYGLYLKNGKIQVNMVQRWLDDGVRVETMNPVELKRWHHMMMTYDGSRDADGVKIYLDGQLQDQKVLLDDLNISFQSREPLRIGAGGGPENRFRGFIDDVRIYGVALSPESAAIAADSVPLNEVAGMAPESRSKPQRDKIGIYFLENPSPTQIRRAWEELVDRRKRKESFLESLPTVMVMQERPTPRDSFLLIRGAYDKPGEKVSPGLPAILPPLPAGRQNNRLGFARWLVDPTNPLTARVAVNRFWQSYFGAGIVRSVEDFGSQGEWPTHPELLDWLATEFQRTGWDVKAMQKLIVTSATYRQSSKVTKELLAKDSENRLVSRGPRLRLPAEVVRDQALAISGLLVEKIGGPSVKPYQPAGLWKELSGADYKQDHGENLYRRSLYTFWKRSSPPPSMMNFDAAGRETCVVRQTKTNTPLQALDLMNDIAYVEAARLLAERMMKEGGATAQDRIGFGFRLATGRRPNPEESQILVNALHYHLDKFKTDQGAALRLLSQGEHPHDEKLDANELAAFSSVGSMILNLDETVTKE